MGTGINRLQAIQAAKADEANDDAGLDGLQAHGSNVKEHGAELQQKVKGKACPHCGKPLPAGC